MSWSPCAEFGNGGAIPASCLSGPFLVSRFCCVPSTRLVVPRVTSIWNRGPVGSTSLPRGRGRIDPKIKSPAGGGQRGLNSRTHYGQAQNISLGHPVVIENVTGAAMEAPFLPPVSAGLFWCLVFAVCPNCVAREGVRFARDYCRLPEEEGLARSRRDCTPLARISLDDRGRTPDANASAAAIFDTWPPFIASCSPTAEFFLDAGATNLN